MTTGTTDHKIDRLVHLLVKNAMVVVPGPKIASEIGVSRSTVWEWIEKLRELGVAIKGHPSHGYQLEKLPDILVPSLVRAELPHAEIGHKVIHYFRTDSTNSAALQLDPQTGPHGTVVIAEEQTAGRGRLGRKWFSEKSSGIYASIVLRPPLSPAAAPILTLLAGVAARNAVCLATDLSADIRWPNDLLVSGKKVCGILTEMKAEVDRLHLVVLGIGINVNHNSMPDDIREIATSLALEGGRHYSRLHILAELLRDVERYYHMLLKEGNAPIVREWSLVSSYAEGKRVRVKAGGCEYSGVTKGLDSSGALKILRDGGRQELLVAGEITELR
ncbi:MAG: biotin--[acetyl-CoA-carboxylase] ligase [Acidobacteria bacterium]|nr:MAG: biotin--[acetyl-CoA-carboxylase] ligase [Acidobacteriota bacterium]